MLYGVLVLAPQVRSVACGHDYTLVATMSYDGPDEDEVDKLQDLEIIREEAERRKERERVRYYLLLWWWCVLLFDIG